MKLQSDIVKVVGTVQLIACSEVACELLIESGCRLSSRKRQVQVADRLVNLLRVLETNRGAPHPRVLKSEPHCFHTARRVVPPR